MTENGVPIEGRTLAAPAEGPDQTLREADEAACTLQRLVSELARRAEQPGAPPDPDRVDVRAVRRSSAQLRALGAVGEALSRTRKDLDRAIHLLTEQRDAEMRKIQHLMQAADLPRPPVRPSYSEMVLTAPPGFRGPHRQPVEVTDGLHLDAYILPEVRTLQELKKRMTPGELYYVPHWNHFAICLAGVVLHGGYGQVYVERTAQPVRVKECRNGPACMQKVCTYYHDPAQCPESRDIRNYVQPSRGGPRHGVLLVPGGDLRDHLRTLQGSELSRARDQAMQLLLSLLLMQRYARR